MVSAVSKVVCSFLYYSNQVSGIVPKNDVTCGAQQSLGFSSAEKCDFCMHTSITYTPQGVATSTHSAQRRQPQEQHCHQPQRGAQ